MLRKSLIQIGHDRQILTQMNLDPEIRSEKLTPQQLLLLFDNINK